MRISAAFVAAGIVAGLAVARPGIAVAAGDVEAGKVVFKKCAICHEPEKGKNKIGPSLWGIVGRPSASIEGFNYSPAFKAANKTWDEATLMEYLEKPMTYIKGTRMAFAGLPSAKEREDVIAYLATLK